MKIIIGDENIRKMRKTNKEKCANSTLRIKFTHETTFSTK
jgi:hypothetical protein